MRLSRAALVLAVLFAGSGEAPGAERLVVSLTNHRVMITSNYTGVELVLFGSVERDAAAAARAAPYDIVATIIGPRELLRTRRKERMLGIWVNTKIANVCRCSRIPRRIGEPAARRHSQPRNSASASARDRQYAVAGTRAQ